MKLLLYGSLILYQTEFAPIVDFAEARGIRDRMIDFLSEYGFNSISAPQLGDELQLIVIRRLNESFLGLNNPHIVRMYGTETELSESCISCPPQDNECLVARVKSIDVESSGKDGLILSKFHGAEARLVQHEIDHLSGTFFFDRASERQRAEVLTQYKGWRKDWKAVGKGFPYEKRTGCHR